MRRKMIFMTRGGSSGGLSRSSCTASLPLVLSVHRLEVSSATQASVHVKASASGLLRCES